MTTRRGKSLKLDGDDLSLLSISVKSINADFGDAFQPQIGIPDNCLKQWRGPRVTSLIGGGQAGSERAEVFQFYLEFGARLVAPSKDSEQPITEDRVVASIGAEFAATYVLKPGKAEPAKDALTEFGEETVAFHVWPYWRELLQSITSRMALPSLTAPLRLLKSVSAPKKKAAKPRSAKR